jgi:hypothetical protein
LRGNFNITVLVLQIVPDIDELVRALAENKSLVRLAFRVVRISDDNWTVLCHSLSRHPKLEFLHLFKTFSLGPDRNSNESKTRRTNVFLVLQKLETPRDVESTGYDDAFDECILAAVIQPYFRHLPHVRAFCRQHGGPTYAKVLALALKKVNDSPALTWMLIRGNIPTILGLQEGNEDEAMVPDA